MWPSRCACAIGMATGRIRAITGAATRIEMPMHKFCFILLTATLMAGLMLPACRLDRGALRGGQLYVTSTPADATLICDGINVGQTPATVMMWPPASTC